MTIQVFGAEATVSYLNRAFNDTSPSYAVFQNQVNRIGGTNGKVGIGDAAFANEFGANFSGLSNADLSKKVLTNLGILPTTDTSVAALEQALTDYFAAFGTKTTGTNGQVSADTRGYIVLQLGTILAGLENAEGNQAVYKAAATAWNNEVTASYTYSINPANTNPSAAGALSSGNTYTLTTGVDTFTGTAGDDTFNAGASGSLNAFDKIDGGAGNDSLTALLGVSAIDSSASITNVEKLAINTSGAGFTVDATTAALAGVTTLSVAASTSGPVTVTAPTTTTVTASGVNTTGVKEVVTVKVKAAAAAGQAMTFDTVTRTVGVANDASTTASATAFTAAYNAALGTNWVATSSGDTITFTNKNTGDFTNLAASDFTGTGFTGTAPDVTVVTQGNAGTASTVTVVGAGGVLNVSAGNSESVNVGQTAVANAITAANVNGGGVVNIKDTSGTSAAVGSTLTTVSLTGGVGTATLESKGLTTLNLTKQLGNVTVTNTTASHALTVNTNGVAGSTVTDAEATTLNVVNTGADTTASGFTAAKAATVNLTATGKDLTVTSLTAGVAKAVNIAGDAAVTVTAATLDAAAVITSTNTKGATVTVANGQKFIGGAGADTLSFSGVAPTVASTLGDGDDKLVIKATAGFAFSGSGAVDAGAGTDTLVLNGTDANIPTPITKATGFEILGLGELASGTYNTTGFTGLTQGAVTGAITFDKVAANSTLTLTASPTKNTTVKLADATGTADALTINLKQGSVAIDSSEITATGVENFTVESNGTVTGNTVKFNGDNKAAKTLTLKGAADLAVSFAGTVFGTIDSAATPAQTGVSSVDGSAATGKLTLDFSVNSGGNFVAAATGLTVKGGSADDTITLGAGVNNVTLGAGKDTLTVTAAKAKSNALFTTVTDAAAGDIINFGTIANTTTKLGAAVPSGVDDYQTFLNSAANQPTSNTLSWFQTGGNTFLVLDSDKDTAGFKAGSDIIVKLTGLIDLSNSTIAANALTIV